MISESAGWYAALRKPSWTPPAWIFGPAWTVLYLSMAVAAWLVWRAGGWRQNRLALGLFALQLALNLVWSPLFFGMHRVGAALVTVVALWLVLAATVFAFWRTTMPAGVLLVPYIAWVTFAASLNAAIWWLNRRV